MKRGVVENEWQMMKVMAMLLWLVLMLFVTWSLLALTCCDWFGLLESRHHFAGPDTSGSMSASPSSVYAREESLFI